jgi:hypothetical protein
MTDQDPMTAASAPEPDDQPPRRGALIALIVIAVLLVGGIWLSRTLHGVGNLQDCVMSGRTNCAPVGQH